MNSKPFWQSKTMWLNAATLLVAILVTVQSSPVFPKAWMEYVVLAQSVLNMILRFGATATVTATDENKA